MRLKPQLVVLLAALFSGSAAHAAFFVSDDTPTVTASHPEAARRETTAYVSFYGNRPSRAGRNTLENLSGAALAADSIAINAYGKTRAQLAIAKRRVAVLKDRLVKQGVPDSKIQAWAELDPEDDPTDNDVQVVLRSSLLIPTQDAIASATLSPPTLPPSEPPQRSACGAGAVMNDQVRLEIARRLMAMAQSKIISQEDAVRLVSDFLAANTPQAASQQLTAQITPAAAAPTPAAQIVPATEVLRTWTLAANQSLQDNLRQWAKMAGYSEPEWAASTPYQVTYSSPYTGTFLQVLEQLSKVVPGLDFQVSQSRHTLRVVDAKH
ncbi:TcpQ domain-containing protein [Burkholderia thailandensis]|uniref:TcpQ domain-containing protein n=1 Tax=Burkholderia thailandensis TaxID=57975 RepID=UPI00217CCB2A|nr:TcpQ domain-containing protein [Burkholderia thailandensis]MCS6496766.1 TcpQ domain-containing protein [Burkholderia thailandensis]